MWNWNRYAGTVSKQDPDAFNRTNVELKLDKIFGDEIIQ